MWDLCINRVISLTCQHQQSQQLGQLGWSVSQQLTSSITQWTGTSCSHSPRLDGEICFQGVQSELNSAIKDKIYKVRLYIYNTVCSQYPKDEASCVLYIYSSVYYVAEAFILLHNTWTSQITLTFLCQVVQEITAFTTEIITICHKSQQGVILSTLTQFKTNWLMYQVTVNSLTHLVQCWGLKDHFFVFCFKYKAKNRLDLADEG